jgi:NitT/TauT family transport system substrate-binding protein
VTYAPHSDALLADPRWRVLFSSRQAPGEVVDVLAVSPELLEHQPRLVTALVNTWWAARRLATAEPQASIALMARRQGVSPAQFVRSQQLISYPDRAQQLGLLASDGPVRRTLVRLETQLRQAEHLTAGLHLPSLRPDLQR